MKIKHGKNNSVYSLWLCSHILCCWSILTEYSNEMCSDVAVILSQCQDVYSADVPVAIQGIARSIVASGLEDRFLSGDDQVFLDFKIWNFQELVVLAKNVRDKILPQYFFLYPYWQIDVG